MLRLFQFPRTLNEQFHSREKESRRKSYLHTVAISSDRLKIFINRVPLISYHKQLRCLSTTGNLQTAPSRSAEIKIPRKVSIRFCNSCEVQFEREAATSSENPIKADKATRTEHFERTHELSTTKKDSRLNSLHHPSLTIKQ